MFNVDSKLFEIASRFASTEATRYRLNGVYIEPCEAGGVALVATDGQRMFVAYDETGASSGAHIVQASKDVLRVCKKGASLWTGHEGGGKPTEMATVGDGDGEAIMSGPVSFVDGTFPDWRRIVPTARPEKQDPDATFNGQYMADMGKAAIDLAKREGVRHGFFRLIAEDTMAPAIVEFDTGPAFAILMPARAGFNSPGLDLMGRINAKKEEPA